VHQAPAVKALVATARREGSWRIDPSRPRRRNHVNAQTKRLQTKAPRAHVLATAGKRASQDLEAGGLASIRHLTPLRRTFASLLLEVGAPPRRVMRLLAHSDAAFTLNVYQHVVEAGPNVEELVEAITGADISEAFDLFCECGYCSS
jgi:integrase